MISNVSISFFMDIQCRLNIFVCHKHETCHKAQATREKAADSRIVPQGGGGKTRDVFARQICLSRTQDTLSAKFIPNLVPPVKRDFKRDIKQEIELKNRKSPIKQHVKRDIGTRNGKSVHVMRNPQLFHKETENLGC